MLASIALHNDMHVCTFSTLLRLPKTQTSWMYRLEVCTSSRPHHTSNRLLYTCIAFRVAEKVCGPKGVKIRNKCRLSGSSRRSEEAQFKCCTHCAQCQPPDTGSKKFWLVPKIMFFSQVSQCRNPSMWAVRVWRMWCKRQQLLNARRMSSCMCN